MTEPRHNPLNTGIWSRLLEGDQIHHGRWLRAIAGGEFVGDCRWCGGYLKPLPFYQVGQTDWYEARCVQCGHEIVAPDGKRLARSSMRSEQPSGWWDERMKALSHG